MSRQRFYYLYSLRLSVLTVIFPFVGRILLLTLFLFPDTSQATTPSNLTCSSNCAAGCSNSGAGKCDRCDSGFGFTVNNSCAPCAPNCPGGCTQAGTCTACPPGCVCTGGGICSSCNSGYVFINGSCTACPSSCAACTSSGTCSSCSSGYMMSSNGYCVSAPPCPTGCAACTASGSCSSCSSGFTLLSNGTCAAAVNDNGCLLIGLVVGLPCAAVIIMLVIVIIVLSVQISKLRKRMKKVKSPVGENPPAPSGGAQIPNNKTPDGLPPRPYQPLNNERSEPNREYTRMKPYGYINDGSSETHIYNSSIGGETTQPYQPPSHQSSVQTQRYDRSGPYSYINDVLPENRSYSSSIRTNNYPPPSRQEQSVSASGDLDSASSSIVNRNPARNTLIA